MFEIASHTHLPILLRDAKKQQNSQFPDKFQVHLQSLATFSYYNYWESFKQLK